MQGLAHSAYATFIFTNRCLLIAINIFISFPFSRDKAPVRGAKKSKERITLGLLCNSTGSNLEKLCVIGRAAKPHSFRNWSVGKFVHYYHNKTAWMTTTVRLIPPRVDPLAVVVAS
jgi:hypothetical protein